MLQTKQSGDRKNICYGFWGSSHSWPALHYGLVSDSMRSSWFRRCCCNADFWAYCKRFQAKTLHSRPAYTLWCLRVFLVGALPYKSNFGLSQVKETCGRAFTYPGAVGSSAAGVKNKRHRKIRNAGRSCHVSIHLCMNIYYNAEGHEYS